MSQKKTKIEILGTENSKLLISALLLGMLELEEKGFVTHDDATMRLYLPILSKMNEHDPIFNICNMADELDTYPSYRLPTVKERIKTACYELLKSHSCTPFGEQEEIRFSFDE